MLRRGGELDGTRILGSRTLELMHRNHLAGGKDLASMAIGAFSETAYEGVGFGLGFAMTLGEVEAGTLGAGDYYWGGAASTIFWVDPKEDLVAIFMTSPAPRDYLTGFTAEFPGATLVRLVRDYRSTPQVVSVANQLMRPRGPGGRRFPPQGRGVWGGSSPPGPALISQRQPGPRPVLTEYRDDASEADGVAVHIRALIRARRAARRRSPCCCGSTRTWSGSSGRWPTRRCPTWYAAPSASTIGPRSARRWC